MVLQVVVVEVLQQLQFQGKKCAPHPKKLAGNGARAEVKHQKMMAKREEKMNILGGAGSRLDYLDALLFSDDDHGILNTGGGNHEKVAQAQNRARVISGKELAERKAQEKVARERQLEAEGKKRKTNAQQKAQKLERRRY
nr:hypothetical transcript [Hymenolepis microstoma]